MLGLSGKTNSFQLKHIPKRNTLADANKKKDVLVFENIYHQLLNSMEDFYRTAELEML